MIWRFKDKKGVPDPRVIERRKRLGLTPLPEIDYTTERLYPHRAYCPACGQKYAVNPDMDLKMVEELHNSACPRMRREIIVVRGR